MQAAISKEERVEIDTSLPFESVKAAVSLFGEKVRSQKPKLHEKPKDVELKHELAKLQSEIAAEEKKKERLLYELDQAKKLLEDIKRTGFEQDSSDGDVKEHLTAVGNEDKVDQTGPEEEEKHVVWERQSRVLIEQPPSALQNPDLETLKQHLVDLRSELLATITERDAAVERGEITLASLQSKTQETEDIKKEMATVNESLVSLKLVCMKANQEKVNLLQGKNVDTGLGAELDIAKEELRKAELEHKLVEATKEMGEIQAQLRTIKENEANANASVEDGSRTVEGLRIELQSAKSSNESLSSSLSTLSNKLEEVKLSLQNELRNINALTASKESVLHELETIKRELKSVKEREANATSAASVLSRELSRIKSELPSALEAEVRANESIADLLQAFEQVKAEADQAKREAESLHNEAIKATEEAEKAKTSRENADILLKKALAERDTAIAAERDVTDKVKSLSTKAHALRASGVESGVGITISNDEYESLKRKVHEAEELANMRVAAALAQVEAVRASEEEILHKLATATEDLENIRNMIKEASHRVEMAEGAKLAVETELKRLREKEQRRREKETAMASQNEFQLRNGIARRPSLSTGSTPPTSGPLRQFLSAELSKGGHGGDLHKTEKQQQQPPPLQGSVSSYPSRKSFSSSKSTRR